MTYEEFDEKMQSYVSVIVYAAFVVIGGSLVYDNEGVFVLFGISALIVGLHGIYTENKKFKQRKK